MTNLISLKLIPNFYKYINFLLLFFLILLILFRPYQLVFFDQEPTYLAEALHILSWSIPWVSHHPGTIISYFYASILNFEFIYNMNFEGISIFLRIITFLFFILLLKYFFLYFNKTSNFLNYSLIFIFIFPPFNIYLSHFGIESFVLLFSFIAWLGILKTLKYGLKNNNLIFTALFIGICLAVKFSAIILLFIYSWLILIQNIKNLKKIFSLLILFFVSFLTFLLLTAPSIRYYPKLFNKINREINIEFIFSSYFIFISIIILIVLIYKNFYSQYLHKFKYKIFYTYLPIFSFILIFYFFIRYYIYSTFLGYDRFYFSIQMLRNFVPLFPLLIIALYRLKFKLNNYSFSILIIFNIFIFYNFFYSTSRVDSFVESNKDKNFIVFSNATFNSKYVFFDYANKRYGNGKINFHENWIKYNNLQVIESDIFFNYVDTKNIKNLDSQYTKDVFNLNENKFSKNILLNKLKSYLIKYYKVIDYSENKFFIFGLERPPYYTRTIRSDYCDQINNKNIIFDMKNNINFITLKKFEENLDKLKIICNISKVKKIIINQNNLVVFSL